MGRRRRKYSLKDVIKWKIRHPFLLNLLITVFLAVSLFQSWYGWGITIERAGGMSADITMLDVIKYSLNDTSPVNRTVDDLIHISPIPPDRDELYIMVSKIYTVMKPYAYLLLATIIISILSIYSKKIYYLTLILLTIILFGYPLTLAWNNITINKSITAPVPDLGTTITASQGIGLGYYLVWAGLILYFMIKIAKY